MRSRLKRLVVCLSLANLLFIEAWIQVRFGYLANHLKHPPSTIGLTILCDVIVLGLLFFVADMALARWRWRGVLERYAIVLSFVLIVKTLNGRFTYIWLVPLLKIGSSNWALGLTGGLALAGGIYWLSHWRRLTGWLFRGALILSPFLLFNVVFVAVGLIHGDADYRELPRRAAARSRHGPRVVWIIFDTLDYHYAFEQRPAWLKMPELDRLRSQSVDFTYALAPGPRTEVSIPALMTRKVLADSVSERPNDLRLVLRDGTSLSFREQRTVFADAEEMGARTALVGFHIPYGRIIGKQVSECDWWQWPNQFRSGESAVVSALRSFAFVPSKPFTTRLSAARQIENHIEEMNAAKRVACDPGFRLAFLHFVPPHQLGMYDPASAEYTVSKILAHNWYFDNLALADASFRQLRRAMEQAGTWDTSLVIVTADHSWRLAGSNGYRVYPRIPFLCHLPSASSRILVPGRMNTLCTYDLVLAYLSGRIGSPQALAGWVEVWTAAHPEVPLTDDPIALRP
ncbi:MAG: hypothetical protein ACHQ50_09850 [Fimbriimonadales bacterium]